MVPCGPMADDAPVLNSDVRMTVVLPASMYVACRERAEHDGETIASTIRAAIRDYLGGENDEQAD